MTRSVSACGLAKAGKAGRAHLGPGTRIPQERVEGERLCLLPRRHRRQAPIVCQLCRQPGEDAHDGVKVALEECLEEQLRVVQRQRGAATRRQRIGVETG